MFFLADLGIFSVVPLARDDIGRLENLYIDIF